MKNQIQYDLSSVKLPRMAGRTLEIFVKLVENSATRGLLKNSLMKSSGVIGFRNYDANDSPTFTPMYGTDNAEPASLQNDMAATLEQLMNLMPPQKGFAFETIQDYHRAYVAGDAHPEQIADRVIEAIEATEHSDPKMNIFVAWNREDIRAQARASSERYQKGEPLGPFDGVPVAVKDEVDMVPFPTTVGTRVLGRKAAQQDSTVVARMRAAGAMLLGKVNMHEIGIGVTGFNPHHGTVRNPYNPNHHTGGSSSGPAAAVAAGICPVAIGADGGGSIRIPASFCGIVGIKPTYGRVSEFGAAPLTWSMGHLGPLAGTTLDACLAYTVLAGPDPCDPNSLHHPAINFEKLAELDLSDLVLGVYWPWFRHAAPGVVSTCEDLLSRLKGMGAKVLDIEIPNLEPARMAQLITIASEMATAMGDDFDNHKDDFALDTRINLAMVHYFTSRDYVHAQRIRTQTMATFQHVLRSVDAIVTPAVAITAPPIRQDALPKGESDLAQLSEIMRFAPFTNLTGHPSISFPAGYDSDDLPIGFQAIAKPWEENVLFRLAYAAEQLVERKAPRVHFSNL